MNRSLDDRLDTIEMLLRDLMRRKKRMSSGGDKMKSVVDYMLDSLVDGGIECRVMRKQCMDYFNCSGSLVDKAKKKAGLVSECRDGVWIWKLP